MIENKPKNKEKSGLKSPLVKDMLTQNLTFVNKKYEVILTHSRQKKKSIALDPTQQPILI